MVNRYIAPGIFGVSGKDTLAPLSNMPGVGGREDVAEKLADRVRDLELRLATVTQRASQTSSLPLRDSTVGNELAGQFVKSRFYGESHWNNCLEPVSVPFSFMPSPLSSFSYSGSYYRIEAKQHQYDALGHINITVNSNTNRTEINKSSELYAAVADCKRMARTIKASRMLHLSVSQEVQDSIPPKETCDQLVQAYLRTFEAVFRVLHVPSFMKEYGSYWSNVASAKPSVLLKILLVCAIGVPFYTGSDQPHLRVSCTKWIQAAESWLSAPHEKSRLNMAGLQIQILLLLARQVCSVDGDLIWVPAGTLLRSAMHLGLHRDPGHFSKISVFHAEMRRRLWATVMEITVQSSLDMGMPPMVTSQDFDTLPPSNVNDDDISDADSTPLEPKPLRELTQTSIQIALCETLSLRLDIVRLINNLRFSLSYDETLRLGSELLSACRQNAQLLQSFLASSEPSISAYQVKLFDTLVRRFVLCLHRPFYAKAKDDPRYYYSRKICLDTALSIAARAPQSTEGEDDDWMRLTYRGVGFMKSFLLHSVSIVYLELVSQLEEQQQEVLSFTPASTASSTPVTPLTLLPHSIPLRNVLVWGKRVTEERVRNGETNAKGAMFLACALARIDAFVSGNNPDAAVLSAAKKAVTDTAQLMRDAYRAEHGADIELGPQAGQFAGREHGRGEGADDVTRTARADGGGADVASGTFEAQEQWSGGAEDMDWEALMADDSLDFGWGFEGSPESWFGWGWERDAPIDT